MTRYNLDDLISLMNQLRHPEHGCPWDLKQTFDTIVPHTLEEAYEVAEAIAQKDWPELQKELGDLLFQTIFYSQLADENDWFDFHDVVDGLVSKMIRRHPHVFPNGSLSGVSDQNSALSDDELHQQWNEIKQQERDAKTVESDNDSDTLSAPPESIMANITDGLPALIKAWKLQKKAASVGFDWDSIAGVQAQLLSELDEIEEATEPDHIEEEVGDLLFCAVNLARHHGVHPETALIKANQKFERRFRSMEKTAYEQKQDFKALNLEQKDALWKQVKQQEKNSN